MDLAKLDAELEQNHLSGFWKTRVPCHEPETPYLWKWQVVRDGLMKAKDSIGIEQAERRAIRLVNPHAPIKSTSRTLQLTFSIVNPGEVASAHRHNMAAIRFVVEGKGAHTVVEGERFAMEEGDLILTPNWTWHDHFNGSEAPIIWLDGLDGPLIQSLNVLFFELYEKEKQTLKHQDGASSYRYGFARSPGASREEKRGLPFRYSWKETEKALKAAGDSERDPYDGTLLRYVNPVTGRFYPGDDVLRSSFLQSARKNQGPPAYQHGALSCLQRKRTNGGRRRMAGVGKGRFLRGSRMAVAFS